MHEHCLSSRNKPAVEMQRQVYLDQHGADQAVLVLLMRAPTLACRAKTRLHLAVICRHVHQKIRHQCGSSPALTPAGRAPHVLQGVLRQRLHQLLDQAGYELLVSIAGTKRGRHAIVVELLVPLLVIKACAGDLMPSDNSEHVTAIINNVTVHKHQRHTHEEHIGLVTCQQSSQTSREH